MSIPEEQEWEKRFLRLHFKVLEKAKKDYIQRKKHKKDYWRKFEMFNCWKNRIEW